MLFARINDAREVIHFPLWDDDVRKLFPHTSFPLGPLDDLDLTSLNIISVPPTATADMPTPAEGMRLVLTGVVWNEDQTNLIRVYSEVPVEGV